MNRVDDKRYLVTGFNAETGQVKRLAEEQDQAGAEHAGVSWLEQQPIGSLVQVMEARDRCGVTLDGKEIPRWPELIQRSQAKRVMGGVEWL